MTELPLHCLYCDEAVFGDGDELVPDEDFDRLFLIEDKRPSGFPPRSDENSPDFYWCENCGCDRPVSPESWHPPEPP